MDRESLIDILEMSNVIMMLFVTWTGGRRISWIVETFSLQARPGLADAGPGAWQEAGQVSVEAGRSNLASLG